MQKSKVPEKGSTQWVKNEKTINTNNALKQARDISEELEKPAHRYKSSAAGKGSQYRPVDQQKYNDNWDRIFGGDRKNVNHRDTGNTDDSKDTKDNL